IADENLGVLRVWVRVAVEPREEFDHLRSPREESLPGRLLIAVNVIINRQPVVVILNAFVLPDDDRHEICRVRLVLSPVISLRSLLRVFSDRNESAVRERKEIAPDGRDHFGRHLLLRQVRAGEPPVRIFGLPLRPDLTWLFGVLVVGFDEVETLARAAGVSDLDSQRLIARVIARKLNRQLFLKSLERER